MKNTHLRLTESDFFYLHTEKKTIEVYQRKINFNKKISSYLKNFLRCKLTLNYFR